MGVAERLSDLHMAMAMTRILLCQEAMLKTVAITTLIVPYPHSMPQEKYISGLETRKSLSSLRNGYCVLLI